MAKNLNKDVLTIVPRKKYMNKKQLLEKIEAGLIPVVFFGHNVEAFYGFLLSRELDIANVEEGQIFDLDYRGEVLHAQFKSMVVNDAGLRDYKFEVVDDEDFVELSVPVVTTGLSLGEKKGANLYVLRDSLLLRGRKNALPKYLCLDVSGVDVNQKVFMQDLELPSGVHYRKSQERALVLECKFKFRDMTLLDAFKDTYDMGEIQEAV